ncbi:hypothetical protein N9Q25_00600 [bacterium]|nr:hypothetical protein [bacterium]
MPRISTYQTVTPQGDDTIIISQANGSPADATKNITVNSLTNLVQEEAGMLYIDTEISSAQLLDLHNTPVELIPEPIDGSFSYPSKVYIKYIFNTTPYTQAGSVSINVRIAGYTGAVLGETFNSYTFSSAADFQKMTSIIQIGEPDAFSTELYTPAALIGGDGTIKVRVYYSVIPSTF